MTALNIRVNGREYHIACDDGQEEHLRLLADEVDERLRELAIRMGGSANEMMLFVLSSLTIADELLELKREHERSKKEIKMLKQELSEFGGGQDESHLAEVEQAMAITLEDIARRIETIAQTIEIR